MPAKLTPIRLDLLLATVLTWLTVATTASHAGGHIGWGAAVLSGLTVAPIALRQLAPVTTMAVMLGAPATYGVLREGTRRWAERVEQSAEEATRAVAEERVRIAGELHDVVAHHMSVISVQAGLAKYVLDTDLPTARRAISTVGDASREALTELRRLLDVLRVDQQHDYRPQPGLAALDELVERARGAGLAVDVVVTGEVRELRPGPDLCAYRVAQESLTNVLKHAGPARARIDVDYGEQTFVLKVTDDGRAIADGVASRVDHLSPTSHGIRGMRERAGLYGGVLTAGPRADGGQAVALALETRPDVILMDIRMPVPDGIAATRRILAEQHDDPPRVVVPTTFDLPEYVYTALGEGASGFLVKDTPPERILSAVRTIAAGDILIAPHITHRLIETCARHHRATAVAAPRLAAPTARETEVLRLVGNGLTNGQIAQRLVLSEATVKTHVKRTMGKLGLSSRAQAVVVAYESGLIVPTSPDTERTR